MALSLAEPEDAGSIDLSASSVNDGTGVVTVQPRKTWDSRWWWYYFTLAGVDGLTPTIDILSADCLNGGAPDPLCRFGFWAYDVDGPWYDFASMTFPSAPARIRFVHSAPFTQDVVHVAHYPVRTRAHVYDQIATWLASPHVTPTATSASSGDHSIYTQPEQSSGVIGDGARTCPASKIHAFTITEGSASAKNVAVITNGVHPGEIHAEWAMVAFIDLLLSDDPRAAFVRQHWRVLVYPHVNPQARYGGLYRDAPDSKGTDHNRLWATPDVNPTVDAIKAAIVADTGGMADAVLDFHGYMHDYGQSTNRRDLAIVADTDVIDPHWKRLVNHYDPNWKYRTFSGFTGLYTYWARDTLGPVFAYAAEAGSLGSYGLAEYKRMGRRQLYALADATERGVFSVTAIDQAGRVYFT